jgi:4-diphosphocytidyl-2-C-methyl-D-erythritol kinase
MTVKAPAKINLHLRVKNRRSDGFHDLESIFLALDFGDTLHFDQIAGKGAIEILMEAQEGPKTAIPMEKNIIFKAVSLFRERTGFQQGLKVRVEKRIPLGAGLGGGSSDAATTLLALNSLAAGAFAGGDGLLGAGALADMAASLGSDVPFFLKNCGAAWVGGRGELIRPVPTPGGIWLVLVNPGFPSDTASAYRLLDQSRDEGKAASVDFGREPPEAGKSPETGKTPGTGSNALLDALARHPREWPFENDFLPVLEEDCGAYQKILGKLHGQGAEFVGLSGAGSTCFGVFLDKKSAEKAFNSFLGALGSALKLDALKQTDLFFIKLTFPLANWTIGY